MRTIQFIAVGIVAAALTAETIIRLVKDSLLTEPASKGNEI
jgi:hypothetical protein